jgi:hypothetical protein
VAGKLGSLLIEIGADVQGLRRDMDRAVSTVDQSAKRINGIIDGATTALAGLGVALVGVGFTAFIKGAIDAADAASKTATKIGITTEEYTKLAYAAKLADVAEGELQAGLNKFAQTLDKASRGVKAQREALQRLGVTNFTDFNAALGQAADTIQKLGQSSKSIALLRDAFGRGGAGFANLFRDGAAGLREAGDEAERFGLVLSTKAGRDAEEFNDNLTRISESLRGLGVQAVGPALEGLNAIIAKFKEGYEEGGKFEGMFRGLREAFDQLNGDPTERMIESITGRIESLQGRLAKLRGETAIGKFDKFWNDLLGKDAAVAGQILKVQLEIVALTDQLKALQDVAKANDEANNRRNAPPKKPSPGGTEEPPDPETAARLSAQAKYLDGLREEIALRGQTSRLAKVEADLAFGAGKNFDEATKKTALALAGILKVREDERRAAEQSAAVEKYIAGLVEKRQKLQADAEREFAEKRAAALERLRTPVEKYIATIQELRGLNLPQDKFLEGIKQARDELEATQSKLDETKDTARDLGLVFQSAFEDAIVAGNGFRDVLKGILQDILRLAIRKMFTEPLVEGIGGFLKGIMGGEGGGGGGGLIESGLNWLKGLAGFANGGSFTVGGSGGTDSQLVAFRATPGERVTVSNGNGGMGQAIVIVNNNVPGATASQSQSSDGTVTIDLTVEDSFGRLANRGRLKPFGVAPPLVSR